MRLLTSESHCDIDEIKIQVKINIARFTQLNKNSNQKIILFQFYFIIFSWKAS